MSQQAKWKDEYSRTAPLNGGHRYLYGATGRMGRAKMWVSPYDYVDGWPACFTWSIEIDGHRWGSTHESEAFKSPEQGVFSDVADAKAAAERVAAMWLDEPKARGGGR